LNPELRPTIEGLRVDWMTGNRPMTVMHDGGTDTIDPTAGRIAVRLRDTALGGTYHLTVPLRAEEICSEAAGGPAIDVQLNVYGRCPEQIPMSRIPPAPEPVAGVGVPTTWHECGAENQGCCGAATCQAGLTCQQLSVCTRGGAAPTTTCSGLTPMNAQSFSFVFKDEWGCAVSGSLRSFLANSVEEAQRCAEAAGASSQPRVRPVSASTQTHNDVAFRKRIHPTDPCDTVYPPVFDAADAESCARHVWCESTPCEELVAGVCPEH
jgi:hypothetical protein